MLKITVTLKTPIILLPNARLTLDSVLHHALLEKHNGDSDKALDNIPLNKVGSVFSASSAFFPMSAHYDNVSRVGALKGENDAGTHLFAPNAKKGWRPFQVVRNEDGVKNLLDEYQAIDTPYLVWFANGDSDEIETLLSGLIGLGKRHTSGHGEIDKVIFELSDDYSIALPDGTPARPIPVSEWEGVEDGLRKEWVACVPPYYSSAIKECVMETRRFIEL